MPTQNGVLQKDDNGFPVMGGTSSADNSTIINASLDPITRRLLTDVSTGSGTVTSVSVVTANGFAGSVADPTTTPAITLSTTVTGIVKGNGTALSAAVANTDYQVPVVLTTTGSSGVATFNGTTLNIPNYGASAAANLTVGTSTITSGTTTRILYDNAGVLGEYTITGSGTVVAMQTSPVFVTDITTPIAKLSATSNQLVFQSAGVTGTMTWTPTSSGKTATIPDRTFTLDNITTATTTPGTGFLKGNGSVISFDNSTYISGLVVGTTTIGSGTTTRILYDNAGVLGEYTLTGSGTVVAMQTAPSFLTSITTPSVLASANDSGALGASGTAFSDLFLASGGVINWNAGNYTLTHSAGILTANNDFRITSANVGTNADSVPTLSSTSTLTNKTLTSPTITTATLSGAQQLAEGASIRLDQTLSADGTYTGTTIAGTAGATLAFGDLVYLAVADSRWELVDADSVTTCGAVLTGFCVLAAAADGDPTVILLDGNIRADANFPALTVGAPVYASTTPGDIQVAQPSGTDDVIHVVGFALTADSIVVRISPDYITHT